MAKEICAKLFLESIAFALAYTSRAYDLSQLSVIVHTTQCSAELIACHV